MVNKWFYSNDWYGASSKKKLAKDVGLSGQRAVNDSFPNRTGRCPLQHEPIKEVRRAQQN